MMRAGLSVLLVAHGVAHLVGFAVPWRLLAGAVRRHSFVICQSANLPIYEFLTPVTRARASTI